MKKTSLLLVIVLITQVLNAQSVKYGKVTQAELRETVYPEDSSAHAAVLYKYQNTYFLSNHSGVELVTEIHERVKIYDKAGFDMATERISLYKTRSSSKERVTKIKAYTYNLEGSKVVRTKLDKDQIFETEVNYSYDEVKFTMPKVKVGSVIEYTYEIRSPFIWNIDEFKFQYDIPIKKLEAELRTPKGYKFKQTFKGYVEGIYPTKSIKRDNRLGLDVVVNKYSLDKVPALKDEIYVDNISNYRAGVMIELESVEVGGYFKSYAQSWKDIAQSIGGTTDYKTDLNKTRLFRDEVDQLLSDVSSKEEKMKALFKYVKETIKWNGYDGKYFQKGIRKILKEKTGNVADINLLLVAMLRYAGVEANPVVISTKDNFVPLFPTLDRLNSVIAMATIDDERYFMDATHEFSDINLLPVRDYNWRGVLVDNKNMKWNLIEIGSPKQAISQYSLHAKLSETGELEGKLNARYANHFAYRFRDNFKDEDLDMFLTERESDYKGIEISNFEANNTDTHEGTVTETFDFYQDDASDVTGNKILFNPLCFLGLDDNPFKLEKREFPVDFGYPQKTVYRINVMLPEGYTVESAPESAILKLPNDAGEFKFLCKPTANALQLSVVFDIAKTVIAQDSYLYLKEFFNQILIKQKEQVILTKA